MLLTKAEAQAKRSAAVAADSLEHAKQKALSTIEVAVAAKRDQASVILHNAVDAPNQVKTFLEELGHTVAKVTFAGEPWEMLVISGL